MSRATPPAPRSSVYSLPCNDVDACRKLYEQRKRDSGGVTSDELRTMLRLQDDSARLEGIVADEDWTVLSV